MSRKLWKRPRFSYVAWQRLPLSFPQWRSLPGLEWMRVTLPWRVERAEVVSGYLLNLGGRDSLLDDAQWSLIVDCPWRLVGQGEGTSWECEDAAKTITDLVGHDVVGIDALSDRADEPVFLFSDGWRLEVSPSSDAWPNSDPYWVQVWGSTYVYNRPDGIDRPEI